MSHMHGKHNKKSEHNIGSRARILLGVADQARRSRGQVGLGGPLTNLKKAFEKSKKPLDLKFRSQG